jgi:N-ethylmaleimide reductase
MKNYMKQLLQEIQLANLGTLKNRVVMSAMTRGFADVNHCATDLMRQYYEKRAKNGVAVILTEGVVIEQSADGYNSVPHIATLEQAESWSPIVKAVHAAGSKIICQLWHCGRISHSDYTGGLPPVSSTSIAAEGINRQNNKPFGDPVSLSLEGIKEVQQQYVTAAKNALSVGFDGVQLHLGHGYLADQFFDARINDRADNYGGSIENRCRFALELIKCVLDHVPSNKVSVRISPSRDMGGIYDWPDLDPMLDFFIKELAKFDLQFLDVSCARADYYDTSGRIVRKIRKAWPGLMMGGASLTKAKAQKEIDDGYLDLVTWGRALIANSDLVYKLESDLPLVEFEPTMLKELE